MEHSRLADIHMNASRVKGRDRCGNIAEYWIKEVVEYGKIVTMYLIKRKM